MGTGMPDPADASGSVFVTSHLVLGDIPMTVTGLRLRADTPAEAVKIIEAGGTAVLPAGDYEGAADVLRRFGADEDHVQWQVYSLCHAWHSPDDADDPFPPPPA
jgi:hypothetical protein